MPKHAAKLKMVLRSLEGYSGALHRRVYLALREAIRSGEIGEAERLPSTRALARLLGVSRNTVLSAYERLADEGYTSAKVGSGTRVIRVFVEQAHASFMPAHATRGLRLEQILQLAYYPVRRAPFCDCDGNAMYLYATGGGVVAVF